MKLQYLAYDNARNQVTGTTESPNINDATESLRRKGLYVIQIGEPAGEPAEPSTRLTTKPGRTGKLKQLVVFTKQLCVLVSSGTQLVEALGALERQTKQGPWRDTIVHLKSRVEEGAPLCEAMEEHSEYFDSVYCSLIAAGESGGNLTRMLDRLATLKQKQLRVRNSMIGAMVYPSMLVVIAAAVLTVLLVFVVPRFATLFETLDVPLPASTKALVDISEAFKSYWWAAAIVLAGAIVGLRFWLITPGGRQARDTAILGLPRIGDLVKSFATARITRLLGVLMEGRVPVLEALRLTRAAAGNVHYDRLIKNAEEQVSRGEPISLAFSDADLISPSVHEAIRSGERSGQIGPLLLNVADFLDEENEVVVRSLTTIIEPVILIVMGLVVGLVAISMFMPLFDLTSMVQGGA